jgi:hypothetical protein
MFVVVGSLLIVLCAAILLLLYEGGAERRAVMISALIAIATQGLAYAIARGMAAKNVIAGWGMGSLLRLVVLVLVALLLVPRFGLPSAAATVSLALFLFVTTLVEPLFLKS